MSRTIGANFGNIDSVRFPQHGGMTKIDRTWIKMRLAQMERGSQARLAEHLGIANNMMSKIMSGTRALKQDEIPKVLSFFNARIVTDDDIDQNVEDILRAAGRLNADGLRILQKQLNEMLQTPSLVQQPESTQQGDSRQDD